MQKIPTKKQKKNKRQGHTVESNGKEEENTKNTNCICAIAFHFHMMIIFAI